MKSYLNVYRKSLLSNYQYKSKIREVLKTYLNLNVKIYEFSGERVSSYTFTNEPNWEMNQINNNKNIAISYAGYILESDRQLYNNMLKDNRNSYITSLNGIFSLSMVNLVKSEINIWNNITRVEPVFWSETEEHIVVGNKALLVHLIANKLEKPIYKVENMVSFLNNGYFTDDNTPYIGLNVLPINSKLTIKEGRLSVKQIDDILNHIYTQTPDEKMYDQITDSFLSSFTGLKEHDATLSLGLTGGKDSRMIVSALHNLGLDFKTVTNGFEDHPDVIVAKKISKVLHLDHEVREPTRMGESELKVNLLKRTYNTIKSSEGMLYSYENVSLSSRFNHNQVKLGGQGGELLRGGFARKSNITTKRELKKTMLNGFAKYRGLLIEDFSIKYQDKIEQYINLHNNFNDPRDILNKFFLEFRTGRWSGASKPAYSMGTYSYTPLFDSKLVREVQLLRTEYGANDDLIYNILMRINPLLLNIPFAKDRWSFEMRNPLNKNEVNQWIKRKPILPETSTASFNWRKNVLGDLKDEFYEGIFGDPNSSIFDIIDKKKVKSLFETKHNNNAYYDKFLWSLYTANIMLSNKWVDSKEIGKNTVLQIPKKGETKNEGLLREIRLITSRSIESRHKMIKIIKSEELTASFSIGEERKASDNIYLQIFDQAFNLPPSPIYSVMSEIENFSKIKLVFEVDKSFGADLLLDVFIMQYNNVSKVFSESIKVTIHGSSQFVEVSALVLEEAKLFKLAIKVLESPKLETFSIKQLRLEGYR